MVTINDVAKHAGVSRGTVSNVINGVKVRPESKEKVEKAIKELGYIPNAYARSLKSNKTHTVALILPSVWLPFFSKLTNEIEEQLRKKGYKMLLCISHDDYQRELDYISMAQENKVEGIIFATYSDITPYLLNSNIPAVAIERYYNQKIPFISTDNFKGGYIAAQKLDELGCKNLIFLGRQAEYNNVTDLRRQGFEVYCTEHQLPYNEIYLKTSSEDFIKKIRQWTRDNLSENSKYDGIFVAVDRYAEHMIEELEEIDSKFIPGKNIQIIGFDGIEPYPNGSIKISSIRQPVEKVAKLAVEMLCSQIENKEFNDFILIEPAFIQGKTTVNQ